jgi:hypothetical protein
MRIKFHDDRFRHLEAVTGGYKHTHRQQGDSISLILFFSK